MLKNYLIIIVILMFPFTSIAQLTKPKTKLYPVTDSVAAAMCTCIMGNKDSLITLNNLFEEINNCMIKNSSDKINELLMEDGYIQTDDRKARAEAVRTVGRKLGQKVAAECSGLKAIIANLTVKENKKITAN